MQACVTPAEKAAGTAAARAEALAGTYVADVAPGQSTRVVEGMSPFRITGLRSDGLRIASDRLGAQLLAHDAMARGAVKAQSLAHVALPAATIVRSNFAQQINQLYDTRDEFDGHGSCGPTSSVMDLAGYQLSQWGLWVNYGGRHWSPYGLYITDQYTYRGHTFNRTEPDYSGHGAWAGAHGWVYSPVDGSHWDRLFDYLNSHTGWAQMRYSWDPSFVIAQLNAGNLVVAGGNVHGYSHIVLIKGYTNDGGWVVNDPFGYRTSGGPGGGDQIYYVGSDMSIGPMIGN
jgi:hypothetical protein